jgi:hypothetical protein
VDILTFCSPKSWIKTIFDRETLQTHQRFNYFSTSHWYKLFTLPHVPLGVLRLIRPDDVDIPDRNAEWDCEAMSWLFNAILRHFRTLGGWYGVNWSKLSYWNLRNCSNRTRNH